MSGPVLNNESTEAVFDLSEVPAYNGEPYVSINGNMPYFTDNDLTTTSFETYSSLDDLGRCGVTYACVGQDIMPKEERGSIGQVKPTGWHTVKYDCVDGKYLYNRCHLIGYQLTGENANEENLITGTRYLNIEGMLPFENMVADFVQETNNHVLYRVTPIFEGENLLANGVLKTPFNKAYLNRKRKVSIELFIFPITDFLIQFHKLSNARSLRSCLDIETVCAHNSFVVLLVCF